MLARLALLFLLFSTSLAGQEELIASLADEVCNCMQEITTERPRGFARACLHRITQEHGEVLEELLGHPFGDDYRKDITELVGHLTAYLAADCPFLQTLTAKAEVTEYRWSDNKEGDPGSTRSSFPKIPSPSNGFGSLAEAPLLWTIEGTVVVIEKQFITVATEEGVETKLEVPKRLGSKIACQVGDKARFSYRLDWRLREDRVVKILVR